MRDSRSLVGSDSDDVVQMNIELLGLDWMTEASPSFASSAGKSTSLTNLPDSR